MGSLARTICDVENALRIVKPSQDFEAAVETRDGLVAAVVDCDRLEAAVSARDRLATVVDRDCPAPHPVDDIAITAVRDAKILITPPSFPLTRPLSGP
jgi:hypothetical protein